MTRIRRWQIPSLWTTTIIIAFAIGAVAMRLTVESTSLTSDNVAPVLYTVREGTVSRTLSFTAQARWTSVGAVRGAASGTVTSVDIAAGARVGAGTRLYSVNLRPVVAAVGAVPAFRDLKDGLHGADVKQLQDFLAARHDYEGAINGVLGASTVAALRAYQRAVGVDDDGILHQGDLLFFPRLPARVTPTDALAVGALIDTDPVLEILPESPTFTITLGAEQADLVPLVGDVLIHHEGGIWNGRIAASTTTADGLLLLSLAGIHGAPVCGGDCEIVPVDAPAVYRTELVVVPETSGSVVPLSALGSRADGSVIVTLADGGELKVEVLAASGGRAVVSGVDVGTKVRLFGEGGGTTPASSVRPRSPRPS